MFVNFLFRLRFKNVYGSISILLEYCSIDDDDNLLQF